MQIDQTVEGTLTCSGTIEIQTHKKLFGFLYIKGALELTELTVVILNGSLSFIGNVSKHLNRSMKMSFLTFKGDITKKAMIPIHSTISFTSMLTSEKNPIISGFRRITNWMRRGHH